MLCFNLSESNLDLGFSIIIILYEHFHSEQYLPSNGRQTRITSTRNVLFCLYASQLFI